MKLARISPCAVLCVIGAASVCNAAGDAAWLRLGELNDRQLREVSGVVQSRLNPGVLWVINDSGNAARVHALGTDGRRLGALRIAGARNKDWEDLAIVDHDDGPRLLVADIGDNAGRRPHVSILAVAEPPADRLPASVEPEWTLNVRYPDGARDAESLAFDPVSGHLLLLSKRDHPPRLYAVALPPPGAHSGTHWVTATRLGEVVTIPPPRRADLLDNPVMGVFSSQPTALTVRDDGAIAVLTYARVYLYTRQGGEGALEALARQPRELELPPFRIAEAMSFLADGDLIVTGEGRPVDLMRLCLDLPVRDADAANAATPAAADGEEPGSACRPRVAAAEGL